MIVSIVTLLTSLLMSISGAMLGDASGTINTLDQLKSTSTPYAAITTRAHARNLYIPFSWATSSGITTTTLCLTGDSCRTTWPTAGGGSGSIGTSSPGVISSLLYFTTSGATPELVAPVATTTLTASSPLSLSNPVAKIGGSNSVLTLDTTGTWSGNSGTATALAANGTNCASGTSPLGVDAFGASESCFDVWTEAENTSAGYGTGSVTSITTTYPILGGPITTSGTLSLAFGTTTPNTWSGLQTFTNTATTTFSGPIDMGLGNHLTTHGIRSDASDGIHVHANNWTNVALLGAGNTANTTFYGAVNIDGSTRLATSLTGLALTTSGTVSAYAGTSCTNQFVRSLNASGVATCATVGTLDVSGLDISDDTNLAATWPVILTGDTLSFGGLSTSTAAVVGNLPYFSGINTFANVATSSVTINAPLTSSGTAGYVVGGSGWTLDVDNLAAADLAAADFGDFTCNGTTCSLDTAYATAATTLTIAGTANQITSSAGAQDLSANRTWTLSLPSHVIFPSSFQVGSASTTHATSTNLDVTGLLTFNGVTASTWATFCTTITGGAGLCDGTDDTGAGGGAFAWTTTTNFGTTTSATSTPLWLRGSLYSLFASSTAVLTNATTSMLTNTGSTWLPSLTSAVVLTDANGLLAEYAGTTCVGVSKVVVALGTTGIATCDFVSLTANVSGTLPVANGGTGVATFAQGWLYSDGGTGALAASTSPTVNYVTSTSTIASSTLPWLTTTRLKVSSFIEIGTEVITNFTNSVIAAIQSAASVVPTGVWDFGGATSLEMPNGDAPTVNATGEYAFDTTSGNFIIATSTNAGGFVAASATTTLYAFSATTSPIVSGGSQVLPSHPNAQVATAVWCKVTSGTSLVINLSDTGTNDTNTITCTTTGAQYALTSNNSFTSSEDIRVEYGTKTGDTGDIVVRIMGYRTSN